MSFPTKKIFVWKSNKVEPVDCNPGMLSHPMALLRWFQLAMYFLLQWLVQITCGNDACTMIMNVFGYTAMGQLFVLLILLLMSIICVLILIAYGLNIHRTTYASAILGERLYAALGIILFIIAGILGTWMAVLANQEDVNYQGRGKFHIKGQWIAAAVFEFLMALLFIGDFLLQRREVRYRILEIPRVFSVQKKILAPNALKSSKNRNRT
ncbi:unnamed protein product [Haemonchus placei]|uniref:MARVEL domain-containing protein n=1 Tax=Haemonchus placei TaxID=6290 RepID=A0A0N4W539_HAEPC|nr:unnamed protein product [Haemonchus placei]